MANEAINIHLPASVNAVQRTVADGATISGGTLLTLADPNTVTASTGNTAQVFGGIAAADKLINDGSTTLAAYMHGTWDLQESGSATAILAGQQVTVSGANLIRLALEAEVVAGQWMGYAEETGTVDTGEKIRVRLRG